MIPAAVIVTVLVLCGK